MNRLLSMVVAIGLAAGAAWAGDSGTAATVNGAVITEQDVERAIDRLIPKMSFHGAVSGEKRKEFHAKALDELVDRELQYQDAVAAGMKPDKALVKEQMKKVRDAYSSKKAYQQALAAEGWTEEELKKVVEKSALVYQITQKKVTAPAAVSPEEVRAYYEQHPEKFKLPESVKVHIMSFKDVKKAQDAHTMVTGGRDFGTVAATMSDDDFRIKGGDVGVIHRGRLLPAVEDAAFKMKPGEISPLIAAEGMWFIVQVDGFFPARQQTFEEVKERLGRDLETKRAKELKETWMAGLRAKAKIEMHPGGTPSSGEQQKAPN